MRYGWLALALAVAAGCSEARRPAGPPREVSPQPGPHADAHLAAAERAVDFLLSRQNPDGGYFSMQGAPMSMVGVTALVAVALMDSPRGLTEGSSPVLARAIQFIVKSQQPSGAIVVPGQGLDNYHTSAAVLALKRTGNPAYSEVLEKAKQFLRGLQLDEGEGLDRSNPFFGGAGYSPGAKVSDMSNTAFWIEAMRELGVKEDDPAMQNALVFVRRVANNPEVNDQPWAKEVAPEDFGGGVYRPAADPSRKDVDISKAGRPPGRTGWRSYGSMTYAMFKSFIDGGASRDDPAVRGALRWIEANYTLDENPGIGGDGQYYYYRLFARALKSWGSPKLAGHDWAQELADKLVALQRADGSWANPRDRWHEGDPALVTAYALEALSIAIDELARRK